VRTILPVGHNSDVTTAPESQWIENAPTTSWLGGTAFRELWESRELALIFAWRELKLRYKQTLLGVAWVALQPIVAMALFSGIFERVVNIPSEGVPYPVFAYAGLAIWTALATGVSRASGSLTEDPGLVTKVYFPRILVPVGTLLPAALDAAVALAVMAPLMAIYGVGVSPALVFLPLVPVGMLFVAFAVSVWLAALQVRYRDVRYTVGFVLQAWLFATPVLYPSSIVGGQAHNLYFLNPAAGLVDAGRACLLDTPINLTGLVISAIAAMMISIGGLAYFRRAEHGFADRI
jgi:lipopolysaccharide transport system permease protein